MAPPIPTVKPSLTNRREFGMLHTLSKSKSYLEKGKLVLVIDYFIDT